MHNKLINFFSFCYLKHFYLIISLILSVLQFVCGHFIQWLDTASVALGELEIKLFQGGDSFGVNYENININQFLFADQVFETYKTMH